MAASSVHEQPFGTPNTLSTSSAQCSQSSSPPFSRTPLAIHSFPCATDAVRLAPATDLQHPSTRRGAPANPPRRQRLCMLHLLRISLACLMTLTSAQSTATTPAATPPSALSPTPLSAPTAARSSPQPPAVPLDLSPLSRSEGSRTSRHDRTKFAPAHHHPHDCHAIGSHAVDYDVDHSAERVFLDFLSLPRLRLARRHTPLRYRFAHPVDHDVDDSADGLRPDSHQRSEEIDEASYGCSTRAVRRLVEGGDVGPKPRQTPFTLSLLESRGVVLESGGPVRPVS